MGRYIDIDAVSDDYMQSFTANAGTYLVVRKILRSVPAADVEEVRHGEWVEIAENSTGKLIYCTNCNKPINPNRKDVELHRTKEKTDYCPNCGAKMDGGKRE